MIRVFTVVTVNQYWSLFGLLDESRAALTDESMQASVLFVAETIHAHLSDRQGLTAVGGDRTRLT